MHASRSAMINSQGSDNICPLKHEKLTFSTVVINLFVRAYVRFYALSENDFLGIFKKHFRLH